MPHFNIVARKPNGQRVTAVEEASDALGAAASLRAAGMIPIAITQVGAKPAARVSRRRGRRGKPQLTDVMGVAKQLGAMLIAGVGLVEALEDLASQEPKRRFREVLEKIRNRVAGGVPLSTTITAYPKIFSPIACAMVKAGEESGNLGRAMGDLAVYLNSQISLRRKVRAALTYPAFIAAFFFLAVCFLLLFLLPKFKDIFAASGADLPLITTYALAFSAWMRRCLLPGLVLAAGAILAFKFSRRLSWLRRVLDKAKISLPIVGDVVLKVLLARFMETLAALTRCGTPILMSLDAAGKTAGNSVVQAELRRARLQVAHGSTLSHELSKSSLFPPMMVRMVALGEKTGTLEAQLSQAAAFYKEETEASIHSLTTLIEPVLIVLMGFVVGFVVMSIYFPVFRLAGSVR